MACHIVKIRYVCGLELGLERERCPMCKSELEMTKKEVLNPNKGGKRIMRCPECEDYVEITKKEMASTNIGVIVDFTM